MKTRISWRRFLEDCFFCFLFIKLSLIVIVDVHSGGLGEEEGWRRRTHRAEEKLRVEWRRRPRESWGRLRQVGRTQGEVRKPKWQRRHY